MSIPVKKRYSPEEKLEFIFRWKASDQSKANFARDNGLKYDTFLHWIQAEKSVSIQSHATEESSSFISLQVDHSPAAKPGIPLMEITLANGSQISFYQTVPIAYLKDLLK